MPSTNELTSAQLVALKANIQADPAFAGQFAAEIAAAYNLPATPEAWGWKTAVYPEDLRSAIFGGGGAAQLDGLTASKRDSLKWLAEGTVDASDSDVRAAIDDFCGSQQLLKAALQASQKRPLTRAESFFATGTGTVASPKTMSFEGLLTYQQVEAALSLP